jgi:hypothetical protein
VVGDLNKETEVKAEVMRLYIFRRSWDGFHREADPQIASMCGRKEMKQQWDNPFRKLHLD